MTGSNGWRKRTGLGLPKTRHNPLSMNVLRLAHAQIRARFYLRIWTTLFYYGGFALITYADWRVALGLFLVLTSMVTRGTMK